ncbi:hypothetical protein K466DRAFT_597778 [Polyporus arcularius HHB13444]|uniref:DUF4246 domain-containing protein n=1 Tax=Polyporus arcularius HHB13444 TaxID=1314778 RepID=A0A5C3PTH9_9APHY|nr:hypothetical protein K466DRAFT_597778 [Polyporus arcularius HHB13444]
MMNTVTLNDIIHGDRWTGDSNFLKHNPRVRPRDLSSPFDFQEREPVTLVELRMRFFSGEVHQKPRWREKINDPGIAAKCRAEMVEHERLQVELCWGGEKRFDIGLPGEKKWPRDSMSEPSAVSKVYESQILIPPTVKSALIAAVSKLEDVSEDEKDWHPRSNHQLARVSLEEYLAARPDLQQDDAEWATYKSRQWLPTDFLVAESGRVRPLGYINNLDPIEQRSKYGTISLVLQRFIPLFEQPTQGVDEERGQWKERHQEWFRKERWPAIPDPPRFMPPKQDGCARLPLAKRTLQVIVKLANIVLTQGNSARRSDAQRAHRRNYYASENITESRLAFRTTIGWPEPHEMSSMYHEQFDAQAAVAAWRIDGYKELLNQKLGHIVAAEDNDVLPQDWSWDELACIIAPQMRDLPRELYDAIMHEVRDDTIDRTEAMELREGSKFRGICASIDRRLPAGPWLLVADSE